MITRTDLASPQQVLTQARRTYRAVYGHTCGWDEIETAAANSTTLEEADAALTGAAPSAADLYCGDVWHEALRALDRARGRNEAEHATASLERVRARRKQ